MAEKEEKTASENPEKEKKGGILPPEELLPSELDKTRPDIHVRHPVGPESKTEIRVKTEKEPAEKKGLFSFVSFFSIFSGRSGFNRFSRLNWLSRLDRLSRLNRYSGIWTADSDTKGLGRITFLFSRILIAVAGVWLLYLLFQSFFQAYGTTIPGEGTDPGGADPAWGSAVPLILLFVAGGALVLSLLSVVLRWSPAWFLGFPLLGILGLLGAHVFLYPTTDPFFFTLLGKAPAFVFNHIWLGILGFEL